MAARRQRKLIDPGSRAPEFRLALLDGGEATLSGLVAEGAVALAFFKITCPVCQFTFPFLERIHNAGLRIYGISQNDPEDTREFNQEFGVTFPTLLDTEENGFSVSNDYGVSSVPTIVIVQADGIIGRISEGWMKRDIEWLGAQAGISVIRQNDRVPEMKPG